MVTNAAWIDPMCGVTKLSRITCAGSSSLKTLGSHWRRHCSLRLRIWPTSTQHGSSTKGCVSKEFVALASEGTQWGKAKSAENTTPGAR